MKNTFLFLWLLWSFCATGQHQQVLVVDNAEEFVAALGSDRTIRLKGSTIYLSDLSPDKSGPHFRMSKEYDGYELVIFGVNNLKIVGMGKKPVKIITRPVYGDVLVFVNATNLTLENIEAGHGPEKGQCTGGVLNFAQCKNVTIQKSVLYGSGMEGITAEDVTNLACQNTVIKECTYSVMTLKNCNEFSFNRCRFVDNQEFDLFNLDGCINVLFEDCDIAENRTGLSQHADYALFDVKKSMSVVLKNCRVRQNQSVYFCKQANSIELTNTKLDNNTFKKGNFMR